MGQVELENCSTGTINVSRKIYTLGDIQKISKPIRNQTQFSFKGWSFCSIKNMIEYDWMEKAIVDTLNKPEAWGCPGDNYAALLKLQEYVSGNNCIRLKKWYGIPERYEYRNAYDLNCIVDANHDDKIIIPLTARETLNTITDLIKNRSIEEIYEASLEHWYHKELTMEHFLLQQFLP